MRVRIGSMIMYISILINWVYMCAPIDSIEIESDMCMILLHSLTHISCMIEGSIRPGVLKDLLILNSRGYTQY